MSRPRIPYEVVRLALLELARGATIGAAAAVEGVSPRSVDRFVCEHGPMTSHATKQRPDDASLWVSHETIYHAIYVQVKGELRKELVACLRCGRTRRRLQGRQARSSRKIVDMVIISDRPAEVDDRALASLR